MIVVTTGWVFGISKSRDQRELDAQLRAQKEEKLKAEREARRYEPGVKLVCLSCETRFDGPLTSDGCPNCHLSTLVISQDEMETNGTTQTK
jgi:Zn finger protein HypA/HybF involved in hydrogenase expression